MSIKIQPGNSDTLCVTCQYSTVITRRNDKSYTHCSEVGGWVPGDIKSCKDYHQQGTPTEWEMQKIAWTLNTDKSGKIMGFTAPKKKED